MDTVSQAIHVVEEEGWRLDRVSAYAYTTDSGSYGSVSYERVLLVFRRADS
ncbi:hypothetical protein [Kitasatospora sp. GP82]|uniref:hypothetical protein n=1 Tax=Kitasatospora sp. GP82 TaxID=3035089 RepID=UPI0024755A9A|nr:hypothetical protein [Kitasatospora sp. GP82]MDH6128227.1 hypothetical protein [Kitasatospora sp. GP82]